MKIRKILPLVILALASVFLLSSCDALLDAIFANDTITVYISAYIPSYCYVVGLGPTYYLSYNTDTMTVNVAGPKPVTGTAKYTGNDGSYMYWELTVPSLSDGLYTVNVSYSHPIGFNASGVAYGPFGGAQSVTLPSSGSHNVNLSFNF